MSATGWQHGLCDGVCGGDSCSTCCASWFCACCLFGRASQRLDLYPNHNEDLLTTFDTNCWIFGVLCCFNLCYVPLTIKRTALRENFGIEGSMLKDGLAAAFCTCCTVAQLNVEMKKRSGKAEVLPQQGYEAHPQGMTYAQPPIPPPTGVASPQPAHV